MQHNIYTPVGSIKFVSVYYSYHQLTQYQYIAIDDASYNFLENTPQFQVHLLYGEFLINPLFGIPIIQEKSHKAYGKSKEQLIESPISLYI